MQILVSSVGLVLVALWSIFFFGTAPAEETKNIASVFSSAITIFGVLLAGMTALQMLKENDENKSSLIWVKIIFVLSLIFVGAFGLSYLNRVTFEYIGSSSRAIVKDAAGDK